MDSREVSLLPKATVCGATVQRIHPGCGESHQAICGRDESDIMHDTERNGAAHDFAPDPTALPIAEQTQQSKDSAAGSIPASLDGGAQQIEAAGPRPGSPASVSMREQIDAALKDPDSELSRFLTAYDEADRASHYHVPSPDPWHREEATLSVQPGDRVLVEAIVVNIGPTLTECSTPQGSDFWEHEAVHAADALDAKAKEIAELESAYSELDKRANMLNDMRSKTVEEQQREIERLREHTDCIPCRNGSH